MIAADIKNLEQNEAAEIPSSVWLKLAAGQSVHFGQITAILRKYHGDVTVYIYDEKKRKSNHNDCDLDFGDHTDLYKSHSLCDNRTSIETMQDSISIPSYSRH